MSFSIKNTHQDTLSTDFSYRSVTSVCAQTISVIAPFALRTLVTTGIERLNISPLLKKAFIYSTIAAQLLYDSSRLRRYTAQNYGAQTNESWGRWSARKIGNLTSYAMTVFGALHIGAAASNFVHWNRSRIPLLGTPNPAATTSDEIETLWQMPGNQMTQEDDKNDVNSKAVLDHFEELNKKRWPFVSFKKEHLEFYPVTNGTCSAMSLSCARQVAQEKCIERQSVDCVKTVLRRFMKGDEPFRNIQAAFNSIAVDPSAAQSFTRREIVSGKMAALSDFMGFFLNPLDVASILETAPDGIYLGRAIQSADNQKLEYWGHTVVLFKIGKQSILYDPNNGGIGLSNLNLIEKLKKTCGRIVRIWGLADFFFFRLTPKDNLLLDSSPQGLAH